jgi:hypothetical protein
MGWVDADDLNGKWNDCITPKEKKAIYHKSGHFDYMGRTVKVYGGGIEDVMHAITDPEERETVNASCTA